jgi:hypothetical protein
MALSSSAQGFQNQLRAADSVVQLVGTEVIGETRIRLIPFFFGACFWGELNVNSFHSAQIIERCEDARKSPRRKQKDDPLSKLIPDRSSQKRVTCKTRVDAPFMTVQIEWYAVEWG